MTEKDKGALKPEVLKTLEELTNLASNYAPAAYYEFIQQASARIEATLAPAVVEPVASGETANTERKNASDYWARHNAPEPEKAQCTREGCTNYTGLVDGCCSFHREERREPPADLSLDAMKALKRLEDGKIYDDYDDEDIEENAKAIETIRQALKARISGVSKSGDKNG